MLTDFVINRNLIPDPLLRVAIRHFLSRRLQLEEKKLYAGGDSHKLEFVEMLKQSPVALSTEAANEQHYEVPDAFFRLALGPHLKYSCGYWPGKNLSLDESEAVMLDLTCQRAALRDGDSILELGCGWGSLTLFMAEKYPASQITAVSNSATQRQYIEQQADERGLCNVRVITADMNDFDIEAQFDRVVSVEMFEHMRNYQALLGRIARWTTPQATLFVHIFTHRFLVYPFEADGSWMAQNFFTGGLMPSDDLLLHFQDDFTIRQHWHISGLHYHRTCEAWLANMYERQPQILELFERVYGPKKALGRWVAWKIFFMACSELFRYNHGREWGVSHYLFQKRG